MYGSDDFEKEVKEYIALVDSAAEKADEETRANMKEHFIMCCKLEYMFWDQAQHLMKWPAHVETKSDNIETDVDTSECAQ